MNKTKNSLKMLRYLSPSSKFYFPFSIQHQSIQTLPKPMDSSLNYESHYDFIDTSFYYEQASTQADSSDGSQQCFACLPAFGKYKTEPCKNFSLTGYCSYGDKCQFAHGNYELNPVFCGSLYKTKKCKNFWKKGFCLYGVRCQFLHSECSKRPSHENNSEYMRKKKHSYLDFSTESRLLKIL